MRNKWSFILLVAFFMGAGSAARAADSASELLEKGIYTEETVGDLPKAIEIYQQVIAEAKTNEAYAAEAQYRLGQCLLKQKKNDEAVAAFQKVIDSYPEQKDWVAKAKKHIPGQAELMLGEVPWKDGLYMQSVMKVAGGMKIGVTVLSIELAKLDGKDVCRMKKHELFVLAGGDNRTLSQVDADTTSYQPIKSFWHHTLLGNIEADYAPDKVVVTVFRNGKQVSTRKDSLNKVYYDMGQAYHVFQRLPLADGYNANVPIYMPLGNEKLELPFDVVGKETIEVPAGKFECYKVQLGIANQTIWISNDANRYIVKIEAGSVITELEQIGINKPGEKRTYKDDEWNFSISAPVGWYFYSQNKPDEENSKLVVLLDPEETALNMLTVSKLEDDEAKDLKADPKKALKSWADKYIEKKGKELKDFKVRPDTWKDITIGGLPALSVIADYTFQSNKKTGYSVFVMGQTNKAHFLISMCDPDKLDALRAEFDKIVDTLKIK